MSYGTKHAPTSFERRPATLKEIQVAANELELDVFFEPQYTWIAEEYLTAAMPPNWETCWDEAHQSWYYFNSGTEKVSWHSPNVDYFKRLYKQQKSKDKSEGKNQVGMTTRATIREEMNAVKKKTNPAVKNRLVRRGSITHAEAALATGTKGHLSDFRTSKDKVVGKKTKDTESLVYTADSFAQLCQYLGIHIIDPNNPDQIECHLIRFVLEFLDRIHADELPAGWVTYHDGEGYPYYYNESTEANTYDHPLANVVRDEIKQARKQHKLEPNVADEWVVFGHANHDGGVNYYNFRTKETSAAPPHIAKDAAVTIAQVLRGDIGAISKNSVKNSFYALDPNSSGTLSMKEFRPVLESIGGMDQGEIETLVGLSNVGADGRFFYVPIVDVLWNRAKTGNTVAAGHKSVNIHGHVHDIDAERNTLLSEEQAWERESELWEIKKGLQGFLAKVEQTAGNPADAWTIIDYNQVMDFLVRAREADAFNVEDPFHVKCYPIAKKAQELASTYEEAEALRQAREMLAQQTAEQGQLAVQKTEGFKKMTALTLRIKAVKVIEFVDGVVDTNLNGFLFPEVQELEKHVGQAADLLLHSQEVYERLPNREQDLKPNMVKKFVQRVSNLEEMVVAAETIASSEMSKRVRTEAEAKRKRDTAERDRIKGEKEAMEKKAKLEEEQRLALEQLDRERIAAEEAAAKEAEKKRNELLEERKKMAEEMELLQKQQQEAHKELEAWASGFHPDEFATAEELEEAEIKREIELEERRQKEEEERVVLEAKQKKMEAEMKAKEEALAKKLAEEAAIRKEEEERKRQLELELQRFEDAKKRDAERKRLKEKEEKRKKRLREKARAAVDADDDDTEEELEARRKATELLKAYDGDVWDACKAGDVDIVRSFFLVHGSKKLLDGKMSRCHHREEWGRTLLHMASWWGNINLVQYLCLLGADVNITDTSVAKTSPLIEASRAGKRDVCELLLRNGANIRHKDAQGDTAIHWASRRGWGTLLRSLVRTSEKVNPGSSRHLLHMKNNKDHTPLDLAANETVKGMIKTEMSILGEISKERKGLLGRMKKGFAHAKIIGGNVKNSKVLMQHKRYGKVRNKKGLKEGSTDSHKKGHKKKKKRRAHKEKHHSERKLEKAMNAAHHDTGDGGVPDELLAMGIGLDDFHYGTREH
jgi:hypothetical protein|eukprot:g8782.t1